MSDKICKVPGCNCKVLSKELCSKHYHEMRRHGRIKDMIDGSEALLEKGAKMAKSNMGKYDPTLDLRAFRKSKSIIKEVEALNGAKYIIKSEPMSFINKRTEAYNMMNGDYGMTKGVAGYQLVNIVEPKYVTQAYILSDALNSENEIVSLKGVQLGQHTLDHPAASDLQIAKMIGYSKVSREYKECINSLIDCGVLFKFTPSDKKIHEVYYFNPVFKCSGKGITPRLFIMFYELFLEMSKKNDIFKYRFENMLTYTLTWLASKTREYSELMHEKDNISINEFNRRLVEMQNSIADDYGLNVEIRLEEPSQISKTFLERELF